MGTTYDQLVHILTGKLEVPAERVRPDALFGELELDSLAVVELEVVLEETFGVELWSDGFDQSMSLAEAANQLAASQLEV
ncbi:acyl carrier protein [Streptomyces sp. V4I23]|uniref:phosphopantetheine-binding protein n=1 Tax=Streptomyces sp. V4I23 TaxID=3042282 RepID=UPI0027885307|nr:phosphopantetheine-binding protein [Streptomyces sp. V4I23]MDQ1005906.1 acyl carrier protein [Streptomyces sp. V4I23]